MPRRRPTTFRLLTLGLCLALGAPADAFDTSRIHDPEVRACADRALPTRTAHQVQRVEVIGRNGYVRESRREMYWKRNENNDSRVVVRMLEPIDDRGVAVLVNDDAERNRTSYMSYSPKFKRVRRVTGESFFGTILATDFTYEDFSYFYRVDEREQVERRDDVEVDGFPAYVLETVKLSDNAHYHAVRFFIDQALCLPMRSEFIAHNGVLRKELVVDRAEVKQHGDRWVPHHVTMIDHKEGTRSVFIAESVEIDPEIDDGMFEVQALKAGSH